MISDLLCGHSVASSILLISLSALIGVLIGKIEFKKIRLGIAGVLFAGLAISHFGAVPDVAILTFIREFGLILFVYAIGLEVGPRFFSSFKSEGLTMNMLAAGLILLGFGITFLFWLLNLLPAGTLTGIMCGAVFNTPSLGSAQQVLSDLGGSADELNTLAMGFAVSYPFGVIGVLLAMILIRVLFRVDIRKEEIQYKDQVQSGHSKLESVAMDVTNPNLIGKTVGYIKQFVEHELAVARVERDGGFLVAMDDIVIQSGDRIHGASSSNYFEALSYKIGPVVISKKRESDGDLAVAHILVTKRKIQGRTIEQIGIYRRYEANITRIYRAGMEILPTHSTVIERGDTLRIVGKREMLADIKSELGDSVKELAIPNSIALFLGIVLGILVGSIPIFIPGLSAPAKLGLAGGPLLVAVLLGHKGRLGSVDFYMTPGANMMLREIGIILFLAAVGLMSGAQFKQIILDGGYIWMIYGAAITFFPVIIIAVIARLLKINYLKICGLLAGSMTNPPALEYANSLAPVQAQATVYATVYPLTMFLRVLVAQIMILTTF